MIIKNCPALISKDNCISSKTSVIECDKNDNCVIKQLIKEFPETKKLLEVK